MVCCCFYPCIYLYVSNCLDITYLFLHNQSQLLKIQTFDELPNLFSVVNDSLSDVLFKTDTDMTRVPQHNHVIIMVIGFIMTVPVARMISCDVSLPVVPPPGHIKFLSVKPSSVVLSWGCPKGLEGPKSFRIKWSSLMKVEGSLVIKDLHKIEINNLELGQKYFFSVATEDEDGSLSEWVTASVFTGNVRHDEALFIPL